MSSGIEFVGQAFDRNDCVAALFDISEASRALQLLLADGRLSSDFPFARCDVDGKIGSIANPVASLVSALRHIVRIELSANGPDPKFLCQLNKLRPALDSFCREGIDRAYSEADDLEAQK